MSKKQLTALGAHIYAGCFSVGVAQHFKLLAHFEEWPFGVETAKHNLKIPVTYPRAQWPIKEYAGKVDFVYMNAPCAPWSQANSRGGAAWQSDPRVKYWADCLELLDLLQPTVWAGESVRGIYLRGQPFLAPYIAKAMKKGYRASHVLVNALEHGVPQSRPRYFLVLSKVDLPWAPTGLKKNVTIADVWRGLKGKTVLDDGGKYDKILKKARPGEDLRATFNRITDSQKWERNALGGVVGRPPFSWKRLREEGQAHVITGGRSFIHPTEHRFLTVEEQAAIMGYPKGFKFIGRVADQYAQIGKAVTAPTGAYLAGIIAAGIRRNKRPPVLLQEEITVTRDRIERRDVDPYKGQLDLWKPPEAPQKQPRRLRENVPACARCSDSLDASTCSGRIKKRPCTCECHTIRVVTPTGRVPRPPGRGSGFRIREMLVKGMQTDAILTVVRKEFPASKAKAGDVYWNKKKLEQQGGVP